MAVPQSTKLHATLLGKPPTKIQYLFYDSGKLGFSDKSLDEERFEAVALLTIRKTMRTSMKRPERVGMVVPSSHEKWVVSHFNEFHRRMHENFKKMKGLRESRFQLTLMMAECFKRVLVGGKGLLQMPEGAVATTSFGWVTEDPLPEWLRQGLFVVGEA